MESLLLLLALSLLLLPMEQSASTFLVPRKELCAKAYTLYCDEEEPLQICNQNFYHTGEYELMREPAL
jgi:hypothetical protein